jgi:uroporphyrinogen-III synthase
LLQLFPLPELPPVERARVLALDEYSHVIFISGNAVQFGMAWIESYWPQLPLGINWYAVGAATARALRDHGVSALTPGLDMTSEGLLALPQLQALADERVLIVKGEGGRATLREALSRRGARVDELACYRRGPPELEPADVVARLAQWQIELAMISSGEGLANLLALLSPAETSKFIHITLLVPSDRVALIARQAGFSRVIVAENASDSAMLRALAQWQKSAGE